MNMENEVTRRLTGSETEITPNEIPEVTVRDREPEDHEAFEAERAKIEHHLGLVRTLVQGFQDYGAQREVNLHKFTAEELPAEVLKNLDKQYKQYLTESKEQIVRLVSEILVSDNDNLSASERQELQSVLNKFSPAHAETYVGHTASPEAPTATIQTPREVSEGSELTRRIELPSDLLHRDFEIIMADNSLSAGGRAERLKKLLQDIKAASNDLAPRLKSVQSAYEAVGTFINNPEEKQWRELAEQQNELKDTFEAAKNAYAQLGGQIEFSVPGPTDVEPTIMEPVSRAESAWQDDARQAGAKSSSESERTSLVGSFPAVSPDKRQAARRKNEIKPAPEISAREILLRLEGFPENISKAWKTIETASSLTDFERLKKMRELAAQAQEALRLIEDTLQTNETTVDRELKNSLEKFQLDLINLQGNQSVAMSKLEAGMSKEEIAHSFVKRNPLQKSVDSITQNLRPNLEKKTTLDTVLDSVEEPTAIFPKTRADIESPTLVEPVTQIENDPLGAFQEKTRLDAEPSLENQPTLVDEDRTQVNEEPTRVESEKTKIDSGQEKTVRFEDEKTKAA